MTSLTRTARALQKLEERRRSIEQCIVADLEIALGDPLGADPVFTDHFPEPVPGTAPGAPFFIAFSR